MLSVIFGYTILMVFISIVRTIITNPGNIPTDKEWDIPTTDSANSSADEISQEHFS